MESRCACTKQAEQQVRLLGKDADGERQGSCHKEFRKPVREHVPCCRGKGEERRDVNRHVLWKHHCGPCMHSR